MTATKKILRATAEEKYDRKRLDQVLAGLFPDNSRAFYQRLIKDGAVRVNARECRVPRQEVRTEDVLEVEFEEQLPLEVQAENIPLPILFEDESLLVINKPAGMVVHPGAGNPDGTLVNALLGYDSDFERMLESSPDGRPGIVHRLDKDTSGCLVIARTPQALFQLGRSFAEREVRKVYAAIVRGVPPRRSEEIVTLIGRHRVNRKKMAVVDRGGKEAVTIYRVMRSGKIGKLPVSLLSVEIKTGRTHQIRVHLAHRGVPIIGDSVYGGNRAVPGCERQMLHAWKLSFPHPVSGEELSFEAPFPDDFNLFMEKIS